MSQDKHMASNLFLSGAAAVIIIAGIKSAADMLVPFLLAIFIAVLSAPLMRWLTRRHIPDVAAVLILVSTAVLGGGALGRFASLSRATDSGMFRPLEQIIWACCCGGDRKVGLRVGEAELWARRSRGGT